MSRRFCVADKRRNEILGHRAVDEKQHELRWRNILLLRDISWLRGHVVLGEVLLPDAAYVSLDIEA